MGGNTGRSNKRTSESRRERQMAFQQPPPVTTRLTAMRGADGAH